MDTSVGVLHHWDTLQPFLCVPVAVGLLLSGACGCLRAAWKLLGNLIGWFVIDNCRNSFVCTVSNMPACTSFSPTHPLVNESLTFPPTAPPSSSQNRKAKDLQHKSTYVKQFLREIQILNKLKHPNILHLIGAVRLLHHYEDLCARALGIPSPYI